MVFKELKKLFTEKEYRLYLVLVIWLLAGFTLLQFSQVIPIWVAIVIYFPLLVFCITLLIVSFLFRRELRELSLKQILIYCALALIIAIFFAVIMIWLFVVIFVIAIISYIFITAIFYMYSSYRYGVDWDDKIYEIKKPFNNILRWLIFISCTVISIFILLRAADIGSSIEQSGQITVELGWIGFTIVLIMIFLAIIGVLTLFTGKLNAWLGIFFLWVVLYTIYLMIYAYNAFGSNGETTYGIGIQLVMYILDVLLIIYTITTIIGEKTEILSEKFKFIKPDAIIMWLIFSKAAYEFAKGGQPAGIVRTTVIVQFLLFIPLLFIAGLYGIISYSKKKKKRDIEITNDQIL